MKQILTRVFLPVIGSSAGFTLVYTLVTQLASAKPQNYAQEAIVTYLLPSLLAFIITLLLYKPVIKLISFPPPENRKKRNAFFFITVCIIAIPAIMSQYYFIRQTGKVVHLQTLEQYNSDASARYYTLKYYQTDTTRKAIYFDHYQEPRGPFYLEALTVVPLLSSKPNTQHQKYSYWLGFYYNESIVRHANSLLSAKLAKKFMEQQEQAPIPASLLRFQYLELETSPNRLDGFTKAIANHPLAHNTIPVIFIPQDSPFEKRTNESLPLLLLVWTIMIIVLLLQLLTANDIRPVKKRRRY